MYEYEIRSLTDVINMFVECQERVNGNTETLHPVDERNIGPGNVDGICTVYMAKLGDRTQKEHFRLIWVKCEAVPQKPIVYRFRTLFGVAQFNLGLMRYKDECHQHIGETQHQMKQ